jgi:hypothetical protein
MIIVNLYINKMIQLSTGDGSKLTAKEIIKKIPEESGIGQRIANIALKEYCNKSNR